MPAAIIAPWLVPVVARAAAGHDALARDVLARAGLARGAALRRTVSQRIVARTRLIDDLVRPLVEPGVEILNLGAGLCTRHLRIGAPSEFLHLDRGSVLDLRRQLLGASSGRTLAVDLEGHWLRGLAARARILAVAEAVLMHLPLPSAVRALEGVRALAPHGHAIFEVVSGTRLEAHARDLGARSYRLDTRIVCPNARFHADTGIRVMSLSW